MRFAFASLLVAAIFSCGEGSSLKPVAATKISDAGADSQAPVDDTPYCKNGAATVSYPDRNLGIALLQTLPDATFTGENGKPVSLHDYFEPCASSSRLLVIRESAAWCGTCQWHAAHTKEIASLDIASRLELVDFLVASGDNTTPQDTDLAEWKTRIDAPQAIALDPAFSLNAVNADPSPLPLYVLVDTRTMVVRNYLDNPDPDKLALRLHQELAGLDHVTEPINAPSQTFDDLFTRDQWDLLHDMKMPGDPPADPTNAHADDPAAAAFGLSLFSDTSLSPSNTVACSTCHDPAKSYADAKPQAVGVATGDRNAPSILLASYARWQFWDGRADSQWMQATGPFENEKEFASSRLFVAHRIFDQYRTTYEAIFGAMPDLSSTARFPSAGKPGDASYDGMAPADQAAVTTVYVNVAKSIEAFERTLRVQPNRLDSYMNGDLAALSADEKKGLEEFFIDGCAQCHWGPRMTDDAFHATRFPTGRQDHAADRGRIDGIPMLLASAFLENGSFSDAPADTHALASLKAASTTLGAFKTPPLRGVADTAPYGHGGSLGTLGEVTKNYGTLGVPLKDSSATGTLEPWLPRFDPFSQAEVAVFLGVLTAPKAP